MPSSPSQPGGDVSLIEAAARFSIDPSSGFHALPPLLDAIVDSPDSLHAWLSELRADELTRSSYWHHNGFAKLVVHQAKTFRVRLHVWPPGADRAGESNPHGHRWDFASAVICGAGLSSTTYVEDACGLPFSRYTYVGGGTADLVTPLETNLKVCQAVEVPRGSRYLVTTDAIHTVAPLGTALVATLLVQGPARQKSTAVYCTPGSSTDQPGLPISAAEVRDLLELVLTAQDAPWGLR